ncbi:MAG: transcription antitermination protein NusB [Acidimicrobiaceae bacterium]
MEGRRDARERALELLYEAQAKGAAIVDVLAELPVTPDEYAVALASGVDADAVLLDGLIAPALKESWSIERLAIVDLLLLRMAVWELRDQAELPVGVVISEAVALAKQFSGEDAGRFVNGVLGTLAPQVRGGAAPA